MNHNIGIMQGRLTPPKGRGIQFFPFDNWQTEFYVAQKIGLSEIEFIFDYDNYKDNPLWTSDGQAEIKEVIIKTGVRVNAVCFDYFMRRPFFKESDRQYERIYKENSELLSKVLEAMEQLKIGLIEIPLVDNSSLKSDEEKEAFSKWLKEIVCHHTAIKFGLETDLNPADFLRFIKSIDLPQVGANYDSGNSSGMGYDPYEEVTTLKDYIFNIHIKDRIYRGTTVQLGEGSADFEKLFLGLKEIGYHNNFILQAARGKDGEEEQNIYKQKKFLTHIIDKYGL